MAADRQTKVKSCCKMGARRRLAAVCRRRLFVCCHKPASTPHLSGTPAEKAVARRCSR